MDESDEVRAHRRDNMQGEDDNSPIVSGWSITVGELKQALADLPDEYEVMLTCADVEDIDICEARIDGMYPPALGSPGIVRLGGGQVVNSEYAYHDRMDAHHAVGGDSVWSSRDSQWEKR